MRTVYCPNCNAQLISPDDIVATCQCSRCNHVFTPMRRPAAAPPSEVAPDSEVTIDAPSIIVPRFHEKAIDEEKRWNWSGRGALYGFIFGAGSIVVTAAIFRPNAPDNSDHGILLIIATGLLSGVGGFATLYFWHSRSSLGRKWSWVVCYSVWITALFLLQWGVTGHLAISGIVCAELTAFVILLFSWSSLSG